MITEEDIRNLMTRRLIAKAKPCDRIVEELGICEGKVIADLAVIGNGIEGFEIKSDADSLRRLVRQCAVYSKVMTKASLVTTGKHIDDAYPLVPNWWGLFLARLDGESLRIIAVREPQPNPSIDLFSLAQLLWRDEAMAALKNMNAAKGLSGKPRSVLLKILSKKLPLDQLQTLVCERLRSRLGWKDDGLRARYPTSKASR